MDGIFGEKKSHNGSWRKRIVIGDGILTGLFFSNVFSVETK